MHLASVGLLIEVIAHELYRATSDALNTISGMRSRRPSSSGLTSLRVLDAQLTTLQKALEGTRSAQHIGASGQAAIRSRRLGSKYHWQLLGTRRQNQRGASGIR